jgi:HSP20 family protein
MSMLNEPMAPWLREFNRLFTPEAAPAAFLPPADVIVTDQAVDVYMDVPGLNADSLEIELENDTLTIRGERQWPYESGDAGVRRIERRFGRFERSLRIPAGLDPDAVEATLSDGVLWLHIPMPKAAQPRRVEIKTGAAGARTIEGQATDSQASQPGQPAQTQAGDGQAQQQEQQPQGAAS